MKRLSSMPAWSAPAFAGFAFLLILAVFAVQLVSFRGNVVEWAVRDLRTQAQLAAESLREPLRTQDFRRIDAFAEDLARRNFILRVYSVRGGLFYGDRAGRRSGDIKASVMDGEFRVELGYPSEIVLQPFSRAAVGFALAALLGVSGMLLLFFAFYRQRSRIAELARIERFRRDFIADVSHEIKTPLTGIIGAAELLEAGSPAEPRLTGMISKEARRLNSLVQQILDLSRLEREGDVLNLEEVDLADLAREVAARYSVESDCGEGAATVLCDAQLVGEAISNLAGNAVRHSGTRDIRISLRRAAGPDGAVSIAVEDHGVGIPPEHAERIFERFHRVEPSRSAESGGAGLGLAIARRIARLHGGDVVYSPASPHGCVFTLTIKSAKDDKSAASGKTKGRK